MSYTPAMVTEDPRGAKPRFSGPAEEVAPGVFMYSVFVNTYAMKTPDGLLLIDPSYEVKADYAALPGLVGKIHAKWNVGVIAVWYPILTRNAHLAMLDDLQSRGLPGVLRHEIRFACVRPGHKLVGSGMFIVNAPYGTDAAAAHLTGLFAGM